MQEIEERKRQLIRKWRGRLKWAPKEVDVYRQILTVSEVTRRDCQRMRMTLTLLSEDEDED